MSLSLFTPLQLSFLEQINFWLFLLAGLVVGSFLNRIIYSLPRMLFGSSGQRYRHPCQILNKHPNIKDNCNYLINSALVTPCCKRAIPWSDSIPLVCWVFFKGKCRFCMAPISLRYFIVELTVALGFGGIYVKFEFTLATLLYCFFLCLLIALFFIDLETYYLPDCLVLSALALGFLGSSLGFSKVNIISSLLGAFGGYLAPWTINFIYRLLRKRDGIGGGDYKLLAVFGSWLGFEIILPILAISAIFTAIFIAVVMVFFKEKITLDRAIPFGPFLILGFGYILIFGIPSSFSLF